MPQSIREFGRFSLDLAEHLLLRDGRPVPLTPRVFDLLRVLVLHAGHLVEKERLLKEVWNDAFVEEANLNRAISVLRKALGETPSERYIETVPKRGYRFVAPVREVIHSRPAESAEPGTPAAPQPVTSHRTGWYASALAAIVVVIAVAVGYLALGRRETRDSARVTQGPVHRQVTFTGKEIAPALSPDGTRIAYVSMEAPYRRVIVQELGGGPPLVVFSAPEASALRWSPDSTELMFWARGEGRDGVYIVPRTGGAVRKVTGAPFVTCWSPDGSTVALALFVPQQIRLINRLGEEQRTIDLRGSQNWIWDLDWSAVHDRLLLVAMDQARRPTIWSIKPDGSDQTKVLSDENEILAARWAPQGDAIFYFTRVNQTVSVFKATITPDFEASGPPGAPLISGLEADEAFGLSADATRLAYARTPYYSNLWLVEAGASGTTPARTIQLTNGTAVTERPRVSPDGNTIVFNMGYESRANLYTMPAAGGLPTQLTFLKAFSVGGVWSPDGQSIAFVSTEGGQPRVWIVRADGSSPRPLPTRDLSENFNLAWSPGPRLLYQRARFDNFQAIDPATLHDEPLLPEGQFRFVSSAEYSPDGQRIVLFWSNMPRRGFWTVDARGAQEAFIFRLPAGSDSTPLPVGWSADGAWVYAYDGKRAVARGRSVMFGETMTRARILKVPIGGGSPPTTVVELPFGEVGGVAMFPDGRRFVASVYTSRSDVWIVDFD